MNGTRLDYKLPDTTLMKTKHVKYSLKDVAVVTVITVVVVVVVDKNNNIIVIIIIILQRNSVDKLPIKGSWVEWRKK